MASMTAGLFFLKFWRKTRDNLFLAFAASFLMEGLNRTAVLLVEKPNEGSPLIYFIRFVSFLIILAAILRKNYGSGD